MTEPLKDKNGKTVTRETPIADMVFTQDRDTNTRTINFFKETSPYEPYSTDQDRKMVSTFGDLLDFLDSLSAPYKSISLFRNFGKHKVDAIRDTIRHFRAHEELSRPANPGETELDHAKTIIAWQTRMIELLERDEAKLDERDKLYLRSLKIYTGVEESPSHQK